MPTFRFALGEVGFDKSRRQVASRTDFLMVGHKASERFPVLQKHKGYVLIVSAVHTIGKIARGLSYGYACFPHNLIIRISDFLLLSRQ
jgi:hypothetical protein